MANACPFCSGSLRVHSNLVSGRERLSFWMFIACNRCGYQTHYDPGDKPRLTEVPKWLRERVKWASIAPWARSPAAMKSLKLCEFRARANAKLIWPWWPHRVEKVTAKRTVTVWPVMRDGGLMWRRHDKAGDKPSAKPWLRSVDYLTFEDAVTTPAAHHLALVRAKRYPNDFKLLSRSNEGGG